MIITKTPVRISFLGGGTDYRESVSQWGGIVIGTTINKYTYITVRELPPFFDYKTRLMYSKIETVKNNEDIEHRVIKAALKKCGLKNTPIEMSHMADLPSNSGTGSSSTFTVGLVNALYALQGETMPAYELYDAALKIEQGMLKENVGCQDQAWAAFGGMNVIEFTKDGRTNVNRILLDSESIAFFKKTLMLFYTKVPRVSSDVAGDYVPSLVQKAQEHHELMRLVDRGIDAINNRNFYEFGNLMHASWDIKKSFSPKVTNPTIDAMFNAAMLAGAKGGKLMGAGGGGCFIFSVDVNRRNDVANAMEYYGAMYIPFEFEEKGSEIIS